MIQDFFLKKKVKAKAPDVLVQYTVEESGAKASINHYRYSDGDGYLEKDKLLIARGVTTKSGLTKLTIKGPKDCILERDVKSVKSA